eukprot:Plantae.Rhodophyta-Purpureofilum_apyrenoidigerum.ctg10460.p1 GENE.Plantae.Rhodophyta-Purpureofilum_apyrenoidigerum.ctg10460~~Plantae.Rhodophyta-Purpureofilum_apyrenoidigerum.ctg10460.p1  ORF type:complete len:433 (-),score=100.27 Plantae.Rhodophyta-Purpureofilum_apyrenoidigerum.ctg10460:1064-2362(-)
MQDEADVEMELDDVAEARALEKEFEQWKDEVGREDELFMAAEEESRNMEVEKDAKSVVISDLSSAEAKERGNSCFTAGNYKEAVKWYDIAANEAESRVEKATILCNRSLVKYKLHDAVGAAVDASFVLSVKDIPDRIRAKAQKRKDDAEEALHSKSAFDLRTQGNNAYKAKDFKQALQLYSLSIAQAQDANERALGLSNRCAAHLALRQLKEAEEDACKVLDIGAPETIIPKTARRLIAALSSQGRSSEAAVKIRSLVAHGAPNSSVRSELQEMLGKIPVEPVRKVTAPHPNQDKVRKMYSTSAPNSVPKSFYEFEKTWRNLKHHPEEKMRYLKLVPTESLPSLFGECLSSELIEDVVNLLAEAENLHMDDVLWGLDVLQALSRTRRFDMLQMLFDESPKNAVRTFLKIARGKSTARDGLEDKITSIQREYI